MKYQLRAAEEVRVLLTPGGTDRLLRLAIAAAEQSSGWGPGEEFCYEIEDRDHLIEGFERSAFVVRHLGPAYDVTFYDGPGGQFIQ